MATAAEPKPASLPLPGGIEGAAVRLRPLRTGTSLGPPGWFHREQGPLAGLRAIGIGVPRSEYVEVPHGAFLVEHPGAGPILIDTGLHSSCAVDPKANLGRLGTLVFPSLEMQAEQAAAAQLRELGIEPADVGTVIMTHLHIDHASAIKEFPLATFLVSASEWQAATAALPWLHGYRIEQFGRALDRLMLDFDRSGVGSHANFGRSFDVFGDGSVHVVYTPGHTSGHMSVVLRLRSRDAVIAGDAVYTRHALDSGVLPYRVEDEHLYRRSLRELQLYVESNPGALVIPTHDAGVWDSLERVYE